MIWCLGFGCFFLFVILFFIYCRYGCGIMLWVCFCILFLVVCGVYMFICGRESIFFLQVSQRVMLFSVGVFCLGFESGDKERKNRGGMSCCVCQCGVFILEFLVWFSLEWRDYWFRLQIFRFQQCCSVCGMGQVGWVWNCVWILLKLVFGIEVLLQCVC